MIEFSKPELISQFKLAYDKIEVKVLQPEAFVASDGKASIPGSTNAKVEIPRMVEKKLLEIASVESGAQSMGSSINVIMAGNFVMTVVFKAAM